MAQHTQAGSPQLEAIGAAFTGILAGLLLALVVATALQRRNLRGTFALPLAPLGYVALTTFGQTFYGWTLVTAGLAGAGFRAAWRRDDVKAGGESNRRAQDALGIQAWVRNRSERRALRNGTAAWVDGRGYALGLDNQGGVVRLPLGLRGGRHTLLIGATGTGKSTTMLWALRRHLDADFGAVVVDAKGSPELVEHCRAEATLRGRPFYCFALDGHGQPWNPLSYGSASERTDKLIAAEEWTEPHYKRLYQRYLLAVFTALDARAIEANLAKVVELLNPDRLALHCREIEDEQVGERLADYLAQLTAEERRDLAGLRNRLAILAEGEHAELLHPQGGPAEEIDLLLAINQGGIVVFSLNSSRYPETAQLLGAAVFQDLKHVAGILESHPELRRPAAIAIDEFAAFGADHALGLFQRARSAGLSLLLATQELADLRRVDPAFQDQVLGNVETIVAHRQNVPDSAELVAGIAGTREVWEHTFQTDDRWNSHARGQSGLGTKRHGHQFIIPPDTIKQLRTGQAVVIQKEPHTARRAAIFQPSPPELPGNGQDAVLEAALRRAAFERMYPSVTDPDERAVTAERAALEADGRDDVR